MNVRQVIEALSKCHPDANVEFSIDFEGGVGVTVVEHEIGYLLEQGEVNPIGTVYLSNDASTYDGIENGFIIT